jgi:glycosyltransferase involved in cell wall biosynthesis
MISALKAAFDFADVANCGLAIPPEDPESLADAIIKMANFSEEKIIKFGNNGRKYVEENHDYPVLTNKLLNIIEEVI